MKPKPTPAIAFSSLSPNKYTVDLGMRPSVACPTCGVFRTLKRSMFPGHDGPEGRRCAGTAQLFVVDVTTAAWLRLRTLAAREASTRRGSPTAGSALHRIPARSPQPSTPIPVCRSVR